MVTTEGQQPATENGEYFTRNGARWNVIAWLLGLVVTALLTYNATAASYDKRITVLEDQYRRVVSDISEIKGDVKELLRVSR